MNNKSKSNPGIPVISPALPKGGGAAKGMGENFSPNELNGTSSMSIPLPVSPCRNFEPEIALTYSSGSGHSPFGMGWELSLPAISRRTADQIPTYTDEDVFLHTGSDYLVPALNDAGQPDQKSKVVNGVTYLVNIFYARTQTDFDQIERFTNPADLSDVFWKVTNRANITSIYGKSKTAKIYDPENAEHIFKWMLEEVYDAKGNHQIYQYIKENGEGISSQDLKNKRDHQTMSYLEKVLYGNDKSLIGSIILEQSHLKLKEINWCFQLVFDYSTDAINPNNTATYEDLKKADWLCRKDPFSDYSTGFEIRTYRLCQKALLFHQFEELSTQPVLTHVLSLEYKSNQWLTLLTGVQDTGYQLSQKGNSYLCKSLPQLSFEYTDFAPLEANYTPHAYGKLERSKGTPLNLPVTAAHYQFIDLYGEGIPGILYNDKEVLAYCAPALGAHNVAAFHPPKNIRFPNGKLNGSNQHSLKDVTANGRLELVSTNPQMAGYFAMNDQNDWKNFKSFESFPSDYHYPINDFTDVTGNGVADIVRVSSKTINYYPSEQAKGYGKSRNFINIASIAQNSYPTPIELRTYAEIIGSGLAQRVSITANSIVCWSNLGYGKFGKKVVMSPVPNFGSGFTVDRLRLADIDGSGLADLIYISTNYIEIYFNQSGQGFSKTPLRIDLPEPWSPLDYLDFADLKGNGTSCLVYIKSAPVPKQWFYDFHLPTDGTIQQSQKSYLLHSIDNNRGAKTAIKYGSSVHYYLEDQANGKRWVTRPPFPVHIIQSVKHYDFLSETSTESSYRYRHGYYDPNDREFKGFALVERTDAQSFDDYLSPEQGKNAAYLPPSAITKTWYHTGAFPNGKDLLKSIRSEFWNGDDKAYKMPSTHWDKQIETPTLQAKASQSLHGSVLRQEVYGNDGSPWTKMPYHVMESQFEVKELQAISKNKYAVYLPHIRQEITYDYERNPNDPRMEHSFVLERDDYGHALESAMVHYGRRPNKTSTNLPKHTVDQQNKTWLNKARLKLLNIQKEDCYLLGIALEEKSYHYHSKIKQGAYYSFSEIQKELSLAPQKGDLLNWERHYYYDPKTAKELAWTKVTPELLHHRTEFVVFDKEHLSNQDFSVDVAQLLTGDGKNHHNAKGGYITFAAGEEALYYWNSGDSQRFHDVDQYCLLKAHFDPFQYPYVYFGATTKEQELAKKTHYAYDQHNLIIQKVVDPNSNEINVTKVDYHLVVPAEVQDINGNLSSVLYDPLGRVIATSETGTQNGRTVGFLDLKNYHPVDSPAEIVDNLDDIINNPDKYLQGAFQYFYYSPEYNVSTNSTPYAISLTNEKYTQIQPKEEIDKTVQISLAYFDGFGRDLQTRTLYNREKNKEEIKWLCSGKVRYTDKGQVCEIFDPYFDNKADFQLEQKGHSKRLFYDALGRQILTRSPEGFFSKVLFGDLSKTVAEMPPLYSGYLNKKLYANLNHNFRPSCWSTLNYDYNDTLLDSEYKPEKEAHITQNTLDKTEAFINTPEIAMHDSMGRTVQKEQLNVKEIEKNRNYFSYDIQGNELTSTDQRLDKVKSTNFRHTYNLSNQSIKTVSADAGTRFFLHDVVGNLIYAVDGKKIEQYTAYDILHRPLNHYLLQEKVLNQSVKIIRYGDSKDTNGKLLFENPEANNLRGKPILFFDEAGLTITPSFDIHGHLEFGYEWLRKGYKKEANWNDITIIQLKKMAQNVSAGAPFSIDKKPPFNLPVDINNLLESKVYATTSQFDALGRTILTVDADGNKQIPTYWSTNWLKNLSTKAGEIASELSPNSSSPGIEHIEYNANGQRILECFNNGTQTHFNYDPYNFDLTEIKTTRLNNAAPIQYLSYFYDPMRNVMSIKNLGMKPQYFENQKIDGAKTYTYNSLYQLIEATGCEQPAMFGNVQKNENKFNSQFWKTHQPKEALKNYTQNYAYDGGGNLTEINHNGKNKYKRTTLIASNSNRIMQSGLSELASKNYQYDTNGNMQTLNGLEGLEYNYRNNIQCATIIKRTAEPNDAEYYIYNSGGERVRKVHEMLEHGQVTIRETIYLGGLEVRLTYVKGKKPKKERHTIRIMDGDKSLCNWIYTITGKGDNEVQLRYQLSDILNSSNYELDGQGQIITFEGYYPYGGTSFIAGKSEVEIKQKHYHYSSKEKDRSTGLDYYGLRYYASWLGRWTATDPAGTIDGLNIYAFVTGNPTTHIDVGGMAKGKKTGVKAIANKAVRKKVFKVAKVKRSNNKNNSKIAVSRIDSLNAQDKNGRALSEFEKECIPEVIFVQEAGKVPEGGTLDKDTGISSGTTAVDRRQHGSESTAKQTVHFVHVATGSKNLMILSIHPIQNAQLIRVSNNDWRFRPALTAQIGNLVLANLHLVSGSPNLAKKHLEYLMNAVKTDRKTMLAGDMNMGVKDFEEVVNKPLISGTRYVPDKSTHNKGGRLDHAVMFNNSDKRNIKVESATGRSVGSDHKKQRYRI